jgi:hypothetical protein
MYLAHELKASFRHSHNLAEDLEKITSQELWDNQRYDYSFRGNGVNCDIGKKTFWHIFDIWSSHVSLIFIINPKFLLSGENRWYYHPTKFGMRHLIVKV